MNHRKPVRPTRQSKRKASHRGEGRQSEEVHGYILLYAVMRAHDWTSLKIGPFNSPASMEAGGPSRFIPLFNTRAAAEKWHGSPDDIIELRSPVSKTTPSKP